MRPVIGSSCVCLIRCVNKVNLYWVHKEMKIVFREIMEIELLMECIANMQKYARIMDTCTLIWSSIFYQENTSSTYNIWKSYLRSHIIILSTLTTNTISHILHIIHALHRYGRENSFGLFHKHVDQYFYFPCCIDVMIQLSCKRVSADPDIMKSQQSTNISISQCTKHQSFIALSL